ncbi:uncharacterized protein LOC133166875 isoform X1 [Syngnathus typhle]|uniref:uncharacterized protein LOC133166875 isoform X1 n=1 Tax=Syngnathus typhle TaxID=161592 RepID=UPI002A6A0B5F|nr:uncharacterized protein LOC133166875 isoform X1 [Syngnathus typhle]
MAMCAVIVKEEYEEELCRLKENEGQRLRSDAVFKTPRVVSHRADVTKNVLPEQHGPKWPSIKKEVAVPPHIKEEEDPGHHCGLSRTRSRPDCDVSSHSSDSDDEHSKGFGHPSNYVGTTTSTGCRNKDRTEHSITIPEGSDNGLVYELNTDEPVCLSREMPDDKQHHEETESFSEQQNSLETLDEDQHEAADSFSYTEEAFVCQMHKQRSGESFHSRELPQHQRDLIVERYQSGEGYKRISKALNISWSTVKSVIVKWRKNGTTVPLPRTGRPSKIDEKTRRELVREAVKRPTATLKELQQFLASTGCSVHVTTISRLLHMSGLWGRVAR